MTKTYSRSSGSCAWENNYWEGTGKQGMNEGEDWEREWEKRWGEREKR